MVPLGVLNGFEQEKVWKFEYWTEQESVEDQNMALGIAIVGLVPL